MNVCRIAFITVFIWALNFQNSHTTTVTADPTIWTCPKVGVLWVDDQTYSRAIKSRMAISLLLNVSFASYIFIAFISFQCRNLHHSVVLSTANLLDQALRWALDICMCRSIASRGSDSAYTMLKPLQTTVLASGCMFQVQSFTVCNLQGRKNLLAFSLKVCWWQFSVFIPIKVAQEWRKVWLFILCTDKLVSVLGHCTQQSYRKWIVSQPTE